MLATHVSGFTALMREETRDVTAQERKEEMKKAREEMRGEKKAKGPESGKNMRGEREEQKREVESNLPAALPSISL